MSEEGIFLVKVIISHDVDHITAWEHSKDPIIPKFILRAIIEWSLNYITGHELKNRLLSFVSNKWNYIEHLMTFDKQYRIPSTFFIGVNCGKYLCYGKDRAKEWIGRIKNQGFDVGVHGIEYENSTAMTEEYAEFKQISGFNAFGIRMHYLRRTPNTLEFLNKIGYVFDSTEMEMKNPYKIGNMWEFPLHVMDGKICSDGARWQNRNLDEMRQLTMNYLKLAMETDISYFTLLFHDRYFSDEYKTLKAWYVWFVTYCRESGIDFLNYRDAIVELEKIRLSSGHSQHKY